VFNVLLQVLDDGRMTDGKGRTVDFKNTILIMTSNLGSDLIMKMTEDGTDYETIRQQIDEILHHQFKPEFLNRVDETIIFHSLNKEEMLAIVDIQLRRLASRLRDKKLSLRFSKNAAQHLVNVGYNPVFGARPLKRAIQRYVEDPLAMEILDNKFSEDDVIFVDANEGGITFVPVKESPVSEDINDAELVD
jgi:ATP-dependent Clp protease ATP-binding subunit ClpB